MRGRTDRVARIAVTAGMLGMLAGCGPYHPEWHRHDDEASTGHLLGDAGSPDEVAHNADAPGMRQVVNGVGGTR